MDTQAVLFLCADDFTSASSASIINKTLITGLSSIQGISLKITVPYYHDQIPAHLAAVYNNERTQLIGSDTKYRRGNANPSWICKFWKDRFSSLRSLKNVIGIIVLPTTFKTGRDLQNIFNCRLYVITLSKENLEEGVDYFPIGPKIARDIALSGHEIIPWPLNNLPRPKTVPNPLGNRIISTFWSPCCEKWFEKDTYDYRIFRELSKSIGELFQSHQQCHGSNVFQWWILNVPEDKKKPLGKFIREKAHFPGLNLCMKNAKTYEEVKNLLYDSILCLSPSIDSDFDAYALMSIQMGVPILVHDSSGFGELLKKPTLQANSSVMTGQGMSDWTNTLKDKLFNLETAHHAAGSLKSKMEALAAPTMEWFVEQTTGQSASVLSSTPVAQASSSIHRVENLYINSTVNNIVQNITGPLQQSWSPIPPPTIPSYTTSPLPTGMQFPHPTIVPQQPVQDPLPTFGSTRSSSGNPITQATGEIRPMTIATPVDITEYLQNMDVAVRTLSDHEYREIMQRPSQAYPMRGHPRGFAVIFYTNQVTGMAPRRGSQNDVRLMTQLFNQLHFEVLLYKDLDAATMLVTYRDILSRETLKNHDAFVLILMSHGGEGKIYASDGQAIRIQEILDQLSNANCPQLVDKPKMVFVQACRGDVEDTGITTEADSSPFIELRVTQSSDIYVAYSTHPGFKSYRDVREGSWFITSIAEVFVEHAKDQNLDQLMNRVTSEVRDRGMDEQHVMCPIRETSLRRDVCFYPGQPSSTQQEETCLKQV